MAPAGAAETCTLVGKELPTEHGTTIHSPASPETHPGKRPNPLHLCSENLSYFARGLFEVEDKLHDDIFETRNGIHWVGGKKIGGSWGFMQE